MTVVQFTGARPQFITGVYSAAYLLRNSSAVTAYLGTDSSLTIATRALTLEPGASVNWDGKSELWAIADPGTTGSLEYMLGSNTSVTPGPKVVDIQNIAGTVNVDGVVSIDGTVNVRANNSVDLLATFDNGGVPLPVGTATIIDTTALGSYQSVIIAAGDSTSAAVAASTDQSRLIIDWLTVSGFLIAQDAPYYSGNGILSYVVPVRGPRMRIRVNVPVGNAPSVALPIVVYATPITLARRYYNEPGLLGRTAGWTANQFSTAIGSKHVSFDLTMNGTQPQFAYFPTIAGQSQIVYEVPNTTPIDARISTEPGTANLLRVATNAVIGTAQQPLTFPEKPVYLRAIGQSVAGSRIVASISWE